MDLDAAERLAIDAGIDLDPAERRRLLRFVLDLGAEDGELAAAIENLNVGGLALELAVRTGPNRPFEEIAEQVELEPEEAARYWRSLGFPDPIRSATTIPDDAAGAIELFASARDLLGEETSLALGRVVGAATSRIAQALADAYRVQSETPQLAAGRSYVEVVRDYTDVARDFLPRLVDAMGVVMIRHLVAIGSSRWTADAEGAAAHQDLAVGFADITGYTALARTLTPRELTRIIVEFEEAVAEAASEHGGRIVKLVGDGALFSADDADKACSLAVAIVQRAGRSRSLPSVRVGLAAGDVVNLGGDLFGPVVNLAARLVAVAPERGVLVDAEVVSRAAARFTFRALPPQELKGIGAPTVAYRLVV